MLAALAERYPFRRVMVACDLIRMALMLLIAIPGLPYQAVLVLIFAATLANPPSQAAKSALIPQLLTGDRLVLGLSLNSSVGQAAQVVGYVFGAAVAAVDPEAALLFNAVTFGLSALLVRLGVRHRPPAMNPEHRSHLLQETAEGSASCSAHRCCGPSRCWCSVRCSSRSFPRVWPQPGPTTRAVAR